MNANSFYYLVYIIENKILFSYIPKKNKIKIFNFKIIHEIGMI